MHTHSIQINDIHPPSNARTDHMSELDSLFKAFAGSFRSLLIKYAGRLCTSLPMFLVSSLVSFYYLKEFLDRLLFEEKTLACKLEACA